MSAPTVIKEILFTDGTTIDSTRSTQAGSAVNYWTARNLPSSGKATLDSSVGGYNCEVSQFYFSGHGSGNYVTGFRYYITDRNSVAQDMTHMMYASDTFTNPSGVTDADIYNMTGDWTTAFTSVPDTTNVDTRTGFNPTDDPTFTQFIFNGVVIEANKTTGTATWKSKLLYQYT